MTTPREKPNVVYGFLMKQTKVSDSVSSESVSHYLKLTGTDVRKSTTSNILLLISMLCVLTESLCVLFSFSRK